MPENTYRANAPKPVENHYTAAWVGTYKKKPTSQVNIPPNDAVDEAKHYVDVNQK